MEFRIAGFWRRFAAGWLTGLLSAVTCGIYAIFSLIAYIQGKPNLGMRAMGLTYSYGSGRMFRLWIFSFLWNMLIITWFINLIMIVMKKGTFPEIWSQNYIIRQD
ncbi:hypothetical protein [Mycoplasma procyoni]|uniref:hypothetical protein n=1 Tax=Mycoplasma procyoni TaxID=568784 RepID=UPI00197C05BB|nr:hypothetical protein [Mycoplasma procyoni]MBN3534884.1 hypothetical protein [Mycoplasma procyoni]